MLIAISVVTIVRKDSVRFPTNIMEVVIDRDLALSYAKQFNEARKTGERLPLLSSRLACLDLASAEQIAELTTHLSDAPVVGYKLGYTSQVMRDQMGIMSPNWGRLTKAMDLRESPQPLLVHPRIEPEIAIVTNRTLSGTDITLEEIQSSIRSVHLALEIVDTRYVNYKFTLEDNTADASSAAAFVLGPACNFAALAESETVGLWENDGVVAQGRTADVMGGPIFSLKWLIEELSKRSIKLEAGMIILTGGLTSAALVKENSVYRAIHRGLGSAEFQWRK